MEQEKENIASGTEPVEVVDQNGRPLAVVAAAEAHRQSLPHRAAMVLFFDRQDRLVLARRDKYAPLYAGRWELPARGHLRPGEAAEEAAARLARDWFPGQGGATTPHAVLPSEENTGFELLAVFRRSVACEEGTPDILQVSREELEALADEYRELFTPDVVFALKRGVLFSAG